MCWALHLCKIHGTSEIAVVICVYLYIYTYGSIFVFILPSLWPLRQWAHNYNSPTVFFSFYFYLFHFFCSVFNLPHFRSTFFTPFTVFCLILSFCIILLSNINGARVLREDTVIYAFWKIFITRSTSHLIKIYMYICMIFLALIATPIIETMLSIVPRKLIFERTKTSNVTISSFWN